MRLPISKVYRAFPELDRFDDARCSAYVRTVRSASGIRGVLLGYLHAIVAIATTVGLMFLFGTAAAIAMDRILHVASDSLSSTMIFLVAVGVAPVLVGGWLGFHLRDRRLRRLIARQIEGSRCPECNYLLLGLTSRDRRIRCPECGSEYMLAELGLTEEQLLVGRG